MKVHLVDGTDELFRHFFGAPPGIATRPGTRWPRCAGWSARCCSSWGRGPPTSAWPPTTSSSRSATTCGPGTRPVRASIPTCGPRPGRSRRPSGALGVLVWPMVELEADDALASGAAVADEDPDVEQVVICTPDKDLGQCVRGTRVVQLDRRKDVLIDEDGRASPSSGSARPPSPTTWPSWATARTGFPAWRAGEPSRPPRSWPGGPTSRTSRRTRATGT